jgi:hypothetical protein
MRRLVLLAALAVPACTCPKDQPPPAAALPAPLALLPAQATLVAHVDLAALRQAPLWDKNRALLDADPDARRTLDVLAQCGVPFDGLATLDLAVGNDGRDVAAVLVGAGVGDPDKVACLAGQLPGRGLSVDRSEPQPAIVLDGARGWFVDPATVVVATTGWLGDVKAVSAGTGRSLSAGALQPLVARVPADRPIWFAGRVPDRAAATLAPALSGLQEVRGALDLRDGLGLELALGMDSDDRAAATLGELRRQVDGLRAAGLPGPVLDRVELGQAGPEVTVTIRLGMAELTALQTLAAALAAPPASEPAGTNEPAGATN